MTIHRRRKKELKTELNTQCHNNFTKKKAKAVHKNRGHVDSDRQLKKVHSSLKTLGFTQSLSHTHTGGHYAKAHLNSDL